MWKSVGCEVQGKGHVKMGIPCQDKTICLTRNGVTAIALADGAGSSMLSHYGAECVVKSATLFVIDNYEKLLSNDDGKSVKHDILDYILKQLFIKAEELDCDVDALASTLLLVAVFEDSYLIIHIGDGVIGYLDGTQLKVASAPENGEFANVTTFVTSNEALKSMRLFKGLLNDISGFVMMSDGT